ncbi:tyrosine-type recombinase/integrase [Kordia sp.]|uniref:tyrosine-type recombinase/integrase n=1 Tax=Kordia sp. TaxID=1965332 RepID=UPI003D6B0BC5
MLLSDLIPTFQRFALYEKAMQPKSIKEIIRIVLDLDVFTGQTVKSITTQEIRAFLYQRKQQRIWSNKTFRNARQYLKTFFDFCIIYEYRTNNPVEKIEKPRLSKQLPRCLTKAQVQTLLLHVDTVEWYNALSMKRNQAIIRTFLFTGIRLSELLYLRTEAVNLEERAITIIQGKGRKDRLVPIHPMLFPYLKNYLNEKGKRKNKYFFSSVRSDNKLTEKNLYAVFQKLQKVCSFKVTPHMLRHTFGKLSIEANLNPFKLKAIMGHADISTTQIYVYASQENIRSSFDKITLI